MGDELEKYVMENRSRFDTEEPGDEVWRGVQLRVRRNPLEQLWKVAAVLFLISTVYLVIDRNISGNGVEEPGIEAMEFGQVEDYYTQLIAEKKAEITRFDRSQLKRSFLMEIEQLDQLYEELKMTWAKQNSSELLVDAMISNLKLRIDILNQQLKILKKLKETKDESESTTSI